MPQMFFGTALEIDLTENRIEEVQIEDSIYEERIGGAGIISSLLEKVSGECIAFGVGPLTGTPCPAGSAAIACIKGKDGKKRYAPILLNGGLEFRLAGFDFLIIKGASKEPAYLWLRDMSADIITFSKYSKDDCWQNCFQIRKEQGDPRIQVISCSDGDHASLNFSSGWDGIGLGKMMREKNLIAVAFRGMADIELSDSEGFLKLSSSMMKTFTGSINGKTGVTSLIGDLQGNLPGLKRSRACYSCPFPCLTYAESGDPSHPEFLVMDQRSLSNHIRKSDPFESIFKKLSLEQRKGIGVNPDDPRFDSITDGISESESIAAAYVLGLCPRYVGLFDPDLEQYCKLLSKGLGREINANQVLEIAQSLLKR